MRGLQATSSVPTEAEFIASKKASFVESGLDEAEVTKVLREQWARKFDSAEPSTTIGSVTGTSTNLCEQEQEADEGDHDYYL